MTNRAFHGEGSSQVCSFTFQNNLLTRIMTYISDSKQETTKKKLRRKRPDGTDIVKYKNTDKWRLKRWAWEFLCRNSKFIADCKKCKLGTDEEKLEVAKRFGLKKFKYYSEFYKGESGFPLFDLGSVSYIRNFELDGGRKKVRSSLSIGQVFLRFDLESALQDKDALNAQVASAKKLLNLLLVSYAEKHNKSIPATTSRKARIDKFKEYIRLLDLLHAKKSPVECARYLYPAKAEDGRHGSDDLRGAVKKPIIAANAMANNGYKYLLLKQD